MTQVKALDFSGTTIFCGVDVHKKNWRINIQDSEFELEDFSQDADPELLYKHLNRKYPGANFKVCYEAGFSGFSAQRQLSSKGINCMVINAADVATSDKEKRHLGLFNRQKTLFEKLSTYDISEESVKRISEVMKADAIKDAEKKIDKRIDKRKQLILLARGKVQAGFKFNKLDNRNVRVDTMHHRIVIVGFNPEILSCTINPWFIPELGIKGFEIIDMSGHSDEVKIFNKVKASCKDSLEMKAIQSNILEKATKNAEKNLQAFFSLILNLKDIKVNIVANELDYYASSLFDKENVTLNEFTFLDTLLGGYYLRNEDTLRIDKMFDTLATKNLIVKTDTIKLSRLTACDSILNKYMTNKKMVQHWQKKREAIR